jgi:hypothetical protein
MWFSVQNYMPIASADVCLSKVDKVLASQSGGQLGYGVVKLNVTDHAPGPYAPLTRTRQ